VRAGSDATSPVLVFGATGLIGREEMRIVSRTVWLSGAVLFILPTVKQEINTILALDPELPPAYSLAGNVYSEVPGPLGGDVETAERMFRKGLELDPRFTSLRVGLAKVLIKQGRLAEARQEIQHILDEKHPESPADWTMKDTTRARALLDTLRKPS